MPAAARLPRCPSPARGCGSHLRRCAARPQESRAPLETTSLQLRLLSQLSPPAARLRLPLQVSLAALHFGRGGYSQASSIYSALLGAHPDLAALHLYLALAAYMMDDWGACGAHLDAYRAVRGA